MRLAVSNIAWPIEDEPAVAALMAGMGVRAVEVAPTKRWPHPLEADPKDVDAYRMFWERHGIAVVALQALLYGRADLTLFESDERREATLAYLSGIFELAGRLGAGPLVFGSPKNRSRGDRSAEEVRDIAIAFFRTAGEAASAAGVTLCIEANPPDYACDWITTVGEAHEFVRQVDNVGFGLHVDLAGMVLTGEDISATIETCAADIRHFHVSEPFLGPLGESGVDHAAVAASLRAAGYANSVSVEMRHDPGRDTTEEMRRVLGFLVDVYGG